MSEEEKKKADRGLLIVFVVGQIVIHTLRYFGIFK